MAFFSAMTIHFLSKTSNENKQRLYKIQKCPTSLLLHVLLINLNECNGFTAKASEQTNTNGQELSQSSSNFPLLSQMISGPGVPSTSFSTTGNSNPPNSSMVYCPKCRNTFSVDQLKLHMPACQGKSCPKCFKYFTIDQLELHIKTCQVIYGWLLKPEQGPGPYLPPST